MIFNIVVDAVVRAVLEEVCSPQEAQHGMVWALGEIKLVFYGYDGEIFGRYHEWVQDALAVTVAMFRGMGLETNLKKTKAMVCTPGFIWGKWGEMAYKRLATVEVSAFGDQKEMMVSCTVCGVKVEES